MHSILVMIKKEGDNYSVQEVFISSSWLDWLSESLPGYYGAAKKIEKVLNSPEYEDDIERLEKIREIIEKLDKGE